MRRYVYNRHQESGKDVISHQVHRSSVPKRTVTILTHDPQEDERHMLTTTLRPFTMCPITTRCSTKLAT